MMMLMIQVRQNARGHTMKRRMKMVRMMYLLAYDLGTVGALDVYEIGSIYSFVNPNLLFSTSNTNSVLFIAKIPSPYEEGTFLDE